LGRGCGGRSSYHRWCRWGIGDGFCWLLKWNENKKNVILNELNKEAIDSIT
jgi:hypothetical protein